MAAEVRWQPAAPRYDEGLDIIISGSHQGGTLHWGVNPKGHKWDAPINAYVPYGSWRDGAAVRTPLNGPNKEGDCFARLGPFNDPDQQVGALAFALQWQDGAWDNNQGQDYTIPITSGRITVAPAQPTLNDPVRITVHRCAPGGKLRWGVNAARGKWQPPHETYWPRRTRAADDGLAVDSPLPDPDANGDATLTLGPFNQGMQLVASLHMAVHWDTTWDTDFGRNYNYTIVTGAISNAPRVVLEHPCPEAAVTTALAVRVTADAGPVEIFLDGERAVTLRVAPFETQIDLRRVSFGRHVLTARAQRDQQAGMAAAEFWHTPAFAVAALPAGTPLGATPGTNGLVTFALHAPGKHFVSVIGDFNRWDHTADVMNYAPDGTWWLQKSIPTGQHYYQYDVDHELVIADPWSRDVEWKDLRGQEDYRPPRARSVLEVGAPPFAWQATNYIRPELPGLVIYEFYLDDMVPGGGFTGMVARLDYIRDLGPNAIEPLPINEFPGAQSWGYNPAFHGAPESAYGTPDDARRLVDRAHAQGMAVILDMVLNHMDWNGALCRLYGEDHAASPYFWPFTGENWGFPDLEQENPALKRYAADMIQRWITEYRADGFRYDATRWVGWQGHHDWGAGWFAFAAKQADPGSIQIAEHLPSDPELMKQTSMDANWHDAFRWRSREMLMRAELDPREFLNILDARRQGYASNFQRVLYTESHDEERVWSELEQAGYAPDEVLRRATAALVLTLTTPGIPMIYAGQEFGENTAKQVGSNPLHWDRCAQPAGAALVATTRRLVALRKSHPALRGEVVACPELDAARDVAVVQRGPADKAVIVALNLGRRAQAITVAFPAAGAWRDVVADAPLALPPDLRARIDLLPGQAAVYAAD